MSEKIATQLINPEAENPDSHALFWALGRADAIIAALPGCIPDLIWEEVDYIPDSYGVPAIKWVAMDHFGLKRTVFSLDEAERVNGEYQATIMKALGL